MSYFKQFPLFSIFALSVASLIGCVFAGVAAYINYLSWIHEGTQGMSEPIAGAANFAFEFAPVMFCISLLVGVPTLLLVKRLTIKHLVLSVTLASSIGILGLVGGSWYWGSAIFCCGFFTALSANVMLLQWQSKTIPNK